LCSFTEKDFIVIKKNSLYFDSENFVNRADRDEYEHASSIIKNFNNDGDLGYEKFAENDYFFIWRKKR
jgi:hypothetical protein